MSKKIKIIVKAAKIELLAYLFDTETAEKIWEILPIKAEAYRWGEEVYFDIPLNLPLEPDAKAEVEIGEIGYWDQGPGMAIFFGKTPASRGNKPVAASAVNIFGKIIGDARVLKAVKEGSEIIINKVKSNNS